MASAKYTLQEMLDLIRLYTPEEIVNGHFHVHLEIEDAIIVLERENALIFLRAIEKEERRHGGWRRDISC